MLIVAIGCPRVLQEGELLYGQMDPCPVERPAGGTVWRHLDDSQWPIVVGVFPGFGDEVDAYFDELRQIMARGQRYVMITDTTRQESAHALQRKKVTDFVVETREASERLCIGAAVIVAGALARGAITAIFWAVRQKYPLVVARDLTHAKELARGWLAQERAPR